ncbi:hypothetical protein BOTBODRAFT_427035 [Botryobasidium botryosum FD-172 SS1]|uniref:Uncharacterized protein n=1 Tax=Botryobasidium botryosum (strain FD-172 SS1) TaxID=930990 RepID=A0A067MC00_BOTB1|nr:hypothetical protein BOTBODRAFT_427035 [Botryobasidium botryosum FD-172 SS1]
MLATSETIAVEIEGKRQAERTELGDLRRRIERLDIDIENQKCRVALPVINVLHSGWGAFLSFWRGSPIVAFKGLVETTKYGVREVFHFRDHLDETNRRLRVMESERTELEARAVALESRNSGNGDTFTASETLKSIASRVKDFSGRLDGLTNIFSELTGEQEYLASYLREHPDNITDEMRLSTTFLASVQRRPKVDERSIDTMEQDEAPIHFHLYLSHVTMSDSHLLVSPMERFKAMDTGRCQEGPKLFSKAARSSRTR